MKNRKVNLIVAGAEKGGTTALHAYLAEHPDTQMSNPKELAFFTRAYSLGEEAYHRWFPETDKRIIGESSPGYMARPEVPERIYEYNPKVKLIFTLRDPCDRAYSMYLMHCDLPHVAYRVTSGGRKDLFPFEEEIKINPDYVENGLYAKHLKRYYKYFPKEQIYLLQMDDLFYKSQETMDKIFNWLELKRIKIKKAGKNIIPLGGKMKIVPGKPYKLENRAPVIDYFIDDIKELEKITKWNLTKWKNTACL